MSDDILKEPLRDVVSMVRWNPRLFAVNDVRQIQIEGCVNNIVNAAKRDVLQ